MFILPARNGTITPEQYEKLLFATALIFATDYFATWHERVMAAAMLEATKNDELKLSDVMDVGNTAFANIPMKLRGECKSYCDHDKQFIHLFLNVQQFVAGNPTRYPIGSHKRIAKRSPSSGAGEL